MAACGSGGCARRFRGIPLRGAPIVAGWVVVVIPVIGAKVGIALVAEEIAEEMVEGVGLGPERGAGNGVAGYVFVVEPQETGELALRG